jgi:hypothetical protein
MAGSMEIAKPIEEEDERSGLNIYIALHLAEVG